MGDAPSAEMVTRSDIRVAQIKTTFWWPHFAYVCRKCEHVIGFASNAPW